MLDLQQLLEFSSNHMMKLTGGNLRDFRLEEAESKEDGKWEVVASYLTENHNPIVASKINIFDIGAKLSQTEYERVFKKLLLDKDGRLLKLSIFNDKK